MRHRRFLLIVSGLLTMCFSAVWADEKPAADKPADQKPDAERILGAWTFASSERKIDLFEGDDQTVRLTFETDSFSVVVLKGGNKTLEINGTWSLDGAQTPKILDLTIRGGDGGSNFVYTIYQLKEDQLLIRIRDNNGPRPVDFETKVEDCQTLTFRRDTAAP